MNEKDPDAPNIEAESDIEFVFDAHEPVSSAAALGVAAELADVSVETSKTRPADDDLSPVYKELATPKLPELSKQNRARLQMQSPNRLYFYWSLQNNPFQALNRALGSHIGSYTLVLKLIDLSTDSEQIHPVEPEGSWWFSVEANRNYRAEIGFYAPNRPYIRALFSNTVQTPRKSPSPRTAESADWAVPAARFAKVLSAAGFARDAFDVALAGDDQDAARKSAHSAFAEFVGRSDLDLSGIDSEELRFALLALASGATLEDLRWRISPTLFAILQQHADSIDSGLAMSIAQDAFGVTADEIVEEERSAAVFGASLISFPRVLKKRRNLQQLSPSSSFSIGK